MNGFEMMFAKMVGMTPAEMANKAKEFEGMVTAGVQALAEIAADQKRILAELEAMKNGPGK